MNRPRAILDEGWSIGDAASSAVALEELLRRHGLVIEPGSPLEDTILEVHRLIEERRPGAMHPTQPDYRSRYRTLLGFQEFASILLRAESHSGFPALIPHLRLLNSGSVLQSSRSSPRDQAANKLFELHMGAILLPYAEHVELDDPFRSTGTNPDILATIGGRIWGIACKVLHGKHPQGLCDLLTDGIRQVEASAASLGIVALSTKNIIPHDELWPVALTDGPNPVLSTAAYSHPDAAFAVLYDFLVGLGQELKGYLTEEVLEGLFHGKKTLPGFLLWGASPMAVFLDGRPTGVNPRTLLFFACGPVAPADSAEIERWQRSLFARA